MLTSIRQCTSIKAKLLIVMSLAVGFSLLLVLSLLVGRNVLSEWQEVHERLGIQTRIIADNCIPAVIFDDAEAAREILSAIKANPAIRYAQISIGKGIVLAEYKTPAQDSDFILEFAKRAYFPIEIELHQDIFYQDTKIGVVQITSSLKGLYKDNLRYGLIAFLVSLLSMVLTLLLSNSLIYKAILPVLALSKTTQRITRLGDYSVRADIYSDDEVGRLGHSFNEMLDEIERKDAVLERTVAERTAELIQLNKQLQHQAQHDPLTGLANRKLFDDRLQIVYTHAKRFETQFALIYFDLDHFKTINDTLGHDTGDEVLIQVTQRMQEIIRDDDTLCRMGGDEFTLILNHIHGVDDVELVAQKMLSGFAELFVCNQHELSISSSIGIAIYPDDTKLKNQLMNFADLAMYHAKQSGRNNYCFFTDSMRQQSEESLEYRIGLKNLLKTAVANREIQVVYQPQVNMQRKVIGVEALLRWKQTENGVISPEVFIPLAEEAGLIQGLEEWAFAEICRDYAQWRTQGLTELKVSLNISGYRLRQKDFTDFIETTLTALGLSADFLMFEIHESDMMQNLKEIKVVFNQLHRQGVKIAVDNFGSGYTSLNYLQQLPIDEFKIDSQFVRQLDSRYESSSVVHAIMGLAHSLKKSVVAVGVENEMQLNHLRLLDCTAMQGYLFAKPMGAKGISALLSNTQYLMHAD